MAAVYPSTLPTRATAGANLSTNPHSTLHNNMYDEIVALCTELGTVPKGGYATVKARLDAMPLGKVAFASTETDTDNITTMADLTGMSATWTATSTRLYRVTAHCFFEPQYNYLLLMAIRNSSNVIVSSITEWPAAALMGMECSALLTGLSGSVTMKVAAGLYLDNTLHHRPSATNKSWISVDDLGVA